MIPLAIRYFAYLDRRHGLDCVCLLCVGLFEWLSVDGSQRYIKTGAAAIWTPQDEDDVDIHNLRKRVLCQAGDNAQDDVDYHDLEVDKDVLMALLDNVQDVLDDENVINLTT